MREFSIHQLISPFCGDFPTAAVRFQPDGNKNKNKNKKNIH